MKFALIGTAGYIAPRHLQAIKATNNELLAALDKSDNVGVMDSYFPQASFFTEFERFDRHIYKLHNTKDKLDFISIASPNYLHDAHIRFALRNGCDAICEKPLVLNPHNIEQLQMLEREFGKRIYTILQLRLHSGIVDLKKKVEQELKENPNKKYNIDLTYITSRGKWYFVSWKGDEAKSGGIASNIGVHFFDMLTWIFGSVQNNKVHIKKDDVNAGVLELAHANVKWFLSVNDEYLPQEVKEKNQRTFRNILVDNEEFEFSEGFTDLHTQSYQEILSGDGFGLEDARHSIDIVSQIRNSSASSLQGDFHPFCKLVG